MYFEKLIMQRVLRQVNEQAQEGPLSG